MNKLKLLLISILLISCNNSEKENQLAKENEILKQKLEQKEKENFDTSVNAVKELLRSAIKIDPDLAN